MSKTQSNVNRYFKSLAGKFTLSQALTTLVVILIIATIFQVLSYVSGVQEVQQRLESLTASLSNYSEGITQDAEKTTGLNLVLDIFMGKSYAEQATEDVADAFAFLSEISSVDGLTVFMLTDPEGIIIQSSRPNIYDVEQSLFESIDDVHKTTLEVVQNGRSNYTKVKLQAFNIFGEVFAGAPILGPEDKVNAMIIVRNEITLKAYLLDFLDTLGWLMVNFILIAIPLIIFLSRRQGKRVSERLDHLAIAAKRWSKGDLSILIEDDSQDEIGEFTTDLNVMAKEFQKLLETKEELAVIKERNRLAIELHDSVKQQVFTIGLKIATIEGKIVDVASKKHLEQMQVMVQNVKEELNRLIHELKPSELELQDFSTALKEYVSGWSESHGIPVDIRYKGDGKLLAELEQSFFRITQEALANILKHSKASQVDIEVDLRNDYSLKITDNGQGFDQAKLESNGIGLQVMKERIEKLGGEFKLSSLPTKGTCIEVVCLPDIVNSIFDTTTTGTTGNRGVGL